jgi:hypothetical protein
MCLYTVCFRPAHNCLSGPKMGSNTRTGRLAQMVERSLSMREARGSIPRSSNLFFCPHDTLILSEDKTPAFCLSALSLLMRLIFLCYCPLPKHRSFCDTHVQPDHDARFFFTKEQ